MKHKIVLFRKSKLLGGYALAIRDDWSFRVKRTHITEEEYEKYREEIGDRVLTESEFLLWWCRVRNIRNC